MGRQMTLKKKETKKGKLVFLKDSYNGIYNLKSANDKNTGAEKKTKDNKTNK